MTSTWTVISWTPSNWLASWKIFDSIYCRSTTKNLAGNTFAEPCRTIAECSIRALLIATLFLWPTRTELNLKLVRLWRFRMKTLIKSYNKPNLQCRTVSRALISLFKTVRSAKHSMLQITSKKCWNLWKMCIRCRCQTPWTIKVNIETMWAICFLYETGWFETKSTGKIALRIFTSFSVNCSIVEIFLKLLRTLIHLVESSRFMTRKQSQCFGNVQKAETVIEVRIFFNERETTNRFVFHIQKWRTKNFLGQFVIIMTKE